MAERHLVKESCDFCQKHVYADEGYHGLSKNHYSCHNGLLERFEESSKKLDALMEDLCGKPKRKKPVREGEGRVAKKCIKLATEAFERETGGKVTNALIWNQKGIYRGQRWDLAAWGVDFDFTLEGHENTFKGSIASWATMTAVSKLKEMKISPSNISYMYEY